MQDKIISQMLDSLRSSGLAPEQRFQLCLLILAWVKVSAKKAIPEELRLTPKLLDDPSKTREALALFGGDIGEDIRIPDGIRPTFELALRLSEAGVLQQLDAADAICALDSRYFSEGALPPEVATLLVALSRIAPGDSVYTPWDTGGQLAARAARTAANVFLEVPPRWPIAAFVSILQDKPFESRFSDPIRNPSAVENGKPRKFDVAVSCPPFGLRYDADVAQQDWFGRFPEQTSSGAVLAIRHLLSQARRRVVVATSHAVLFSGGVEQQLREDLVRKGIVEAVIDLPSGVFTTTNIPFAILVLDPAGGHDNIRFINADSQEYREPVSKARSRLINLDGLVELVFNEVETENTAVVASSDVLKQEALLLVGRYLLPAAKKRVLQLIRNRDCRLLGELVFTVRPMPTITATQDSIEAREIGAADLPPFGYITTPGRSVLIDRLVSSNNAKQFLRPLDLVLIIKGSVGKLGIVPKEVPPPGPGGWVAGQSAIVLRSNESVIDPRAMAVQLRSELGQEVLKFATTGATIPLIPLKMLLKLPIFVPDRETVQKAVDALEQETKLQREIDRLHQAQTEFAKDLWTL
jgi:type I restriction enzyme M protein